MIDIQDFWTKRNEAKNELAEDSSENKQEKEPTTKKVPQGVMELFNIFFRLQPRHENKPVFNAYQAQFQIEENDIADTQDIQDIIGHTFLGMAISRSSDTMAALDLVMEPSNGYQKEIDSIETIIEKNIDSIQDELEDDKSEREVTEAFKDMVLDTFDEEKSKPKYVKDLLATMDDKDWYHLAIQFVEINQIHDSKIEVLRQAVKDSIKSDTLAKKYITKEEGDIKLAPLRVDIDNELLRTEDEIVTELLKQYKPVLRANKVLEFRRLNIMQNWFNNNIDDILEGNTLLAIDDKTKTELDNLTKLFSEDISQFITDPKSEESKAESRAYLHSSKQVYNKFGKLMKEYIRTPEAKEAIAQGLEELVNKKTNKDNVKLIVAEFLKQFEALKD